MIGYKKVRPLPQVDAAYIGGLIDGEGTVTLSRKHAGETRQLVVSISNTEAPILDYVLKTVGAGKITRKRTVAAHHTPSLGAIRSVRRNELGRMEIALHGSAEILPVSQPFQWRFRGM